MIEESFETISPKEFKINENEHCVQFECQGCGDKTKPCTLCQGTNEIIHHILYVSEHYLWIDDLADVYICETCNINDYLKNVSQEKIATEKIYAFARNF